MSTTLHLEVVSASSPEFPDGAVVFTSLVGTNNEKKERAIESRFPNRNTALLSNTQQSTTYLAWLDSGKPSEYVREAAV